MSTNPVSGNMRSTEVLLQRLQNVSPHQQAEMQSVMSGSFDTVSLSFLGKEFNDYYQVLQREGDEEALEGLRQMAIHLVQNPNSQQAVGVTQALGAAKDENPAFLANFFQGVQEVQDGSHDLGKWLSTFLRIDSTSLQEQFVSTSRAIMALDGDADDVAATFRDYLGTVNSIANHFDEDEVGEQLGNFFNRFDGLETVDQHRETIENYRSEMEWE